MKTIPFNICEDSDEITKCNTSEYEPDGWVSTDGVKLNSTDGGYFYDPKALKNMAKFHKKHKKKALKKALKKKIKKLETE